MTSDFVGAEHEFHSKEFALGWAQRFEPTPERLRLFEMIFSELKQSVPDDGNIIELGIGPGYLADFLLQRIPGVSYRGIDFSQPMLEIARERLQQHASRVSYMQAELVDQAWEQLIAPPVHAIVSTWALHDLGNPENIANVYRRAYRALGANGILINGDFIKPDEAPQQFEAGRFPVARHLQMLADIGYLAPSCLSLFETEIQNPTAAQNYACIRAGK